MLNDRRLQILSALIAEYVACAHPVSSRALVDGYGLTCSPATVRNDLAALEDEGLAYQPHVSAGRIPTEEGYRVHVGGLVDEARATVDRRDAEVVRRRLAAIEHDAAELVREAATIVAGLTGYASVVVAPPAAVERVLRVDLVTMGPHEVLVVVITEAGRVLRRSVELSSPVTPEVVGDVETLLLQTVTHRHQSEVDAVRHELMRDPTPLRKLAVALLDEVVVCLHDEREARVASGGLGALLDLPEFADPRVARPVVSLMQDSGAAAGALREIAGPGETVVRIGHDNAISGLQGISVVATAYGGRERCGVVCVLGPTRMEYVRAVATTACVADTLSEAL